MFNASAIVGDRDLDLEFLELLCVEKPLWFIFELGVAPSKSIGRVSWSICNLNSSDYLWEAEAWGRLAWFSCSSLTCLCVVLADEPEGIGTLDRLIPVAAVIDFWCCFLADRLMDFWFSLCSISPGYISEILDWVVDAPFRAPFTRFIALGGPVAPAGAPLLDFVAFGVCPFTDP